MADHDSGQVEHMSNFVLSTPHTERATQGSQSVLLTFDSVCANCVRSSQDGPSNSLSIWIPLKTLPVMDF